MILMVEDNPADTILAMNALGKSSLANEVLSFDTAEDALAYLRATATLPILVLVDLGLPQMDGLEFIHQVRAAPEYRALKIVILTGRADDAETFEEAGADAFMHKPLTPEKLIMTLRPLNLGWQIVRVS